MMMVWPRYFYTSLAIGCTLYCVLVADVGFEREYISVNEDTGSFQWCVRVFTNASLLPINTEFSLDLFSVADSAGR